MERSYSNFYGPDRARMSTPSSQRRNLPNSPHSMRINSVKSEDFSTLPRSPKSKCDRRQHLQQMHAENEKLCDRVSETYMVSCGSILGLGCVCV